MADARLVSYRKAARNLNNIIRTLQSTSERLERWLDRARSAKRIDVRKIRESAVPLFDSLKGRMREAESALSDLIGVASS